VKRRERGDMRAKYVKYYKRENAKYPFERGEMRNRESLFFLIHLSIGICVFSRHKKKR
jgi:hypothetical protein